MKPFCSIQLSHSLNSLLRAASSVVISVSLNWAAPWQFPLIRRKVFTLHEALLVFQLGWQNDKTWELSEEESLALYKTCILVKALWHKPKAKETFMNSQWARAYSKPDEVFHEIIPGLMDTIAGELVLSLEQLPDFATIKAELDKGVEEELTKETT